MANVFRTVSPSRRVGLVIPASALARELAGADAVSWQVSEPAAMSSADTVVYVPRMAAGMDLRPDLLHAADALTALTQMRPGHVVVVSSTAVYGATPHHAGLTAERRVAAGSAQPIARAWQDLESLAADAFGGRLTVLRAAPVVARGECDFFARLLSSRLAFTVAGHDPTVQFLSPRDLAAAILRAIEEGPDGTFNIVPAAPITLRGALREAGVVRIPVPWTLHRLSRFVLRRLTGSASADQVQYVRYHLTAAPEKAADTLGFVPKDSSAAAVCGLRGNVGPSVGPSHSDPFGLDPDYIRACDRGFLGFMRRKYWRVETQGLEHLPRTGGAVLVGMHRGFMPFDGVMTLLGVVEGTGRIPRFLIHPGVGLRFPYLFNLMSKLGGVIACQENADRVLAAGELLGVYPEGIRGAFTMYKRAHRIGPSWRNDCIAFALRHRVPIVPFVTIGSAEVFPIVGRIDWRWWKQYTEWPFIPITTPVPLPSKWHTQFLEPICVEREYPPEAAADAAVVRAIGADVKRRMESATAHLLSRRRSRFVGSLLGEAQP